MDEQLRQFTGKTTLLKPQTEPEDLSIDVLTNDLVNLVTTVFTDVEKAPTLLVRLLLFE